MEHHDIDKDHCSIFYAGDSDVTNRLRTSKARTDVAKHSKEELASSAL